MPLRPEAPVFWLLTFIVVPAAALDGAPNLRATHHVFAAFESALACDR